MSVTQTNMASRYYVQQYPFIGANLSANGGTLQFPGTLQAQEFWMPRRGSIIGFSGSLNAPLTAGTLTFQPTINGSLAPAFTNARLHVSSQAVYETKDGNTDNLIFTAGQAIGVSYTASDGVTPATVDGVFIIETLMQDVNY